MKNRLKWFLRLKFAPSLSLFLYDYETWSRVYLLKKYLKSVDPHCSKRIIDIGGGTGRLTVLLKRKDIYIYDNSEEAVRKAGALFRNVKVGTGANIDYPDNYFDYSVSTHTLEHLPEESRESFMSEMLRVSKEGIYLLFPEGKHAKLMGERYNEALVNRGRPENRWIREHLEMKLPMREAIESYLQKQSGFTFTYRHLKNYGAETFFWTRLSLSGNLFVRNMLLPLFSIYRHLKLHSKPAVELLVIGRRVDNGGLKDKL